MSGVYLFAAELTAYYDSFLQERIRPEDLPDRLLAILEVYEEYEPWLGELETPQPDGAHLTEQWPRWWSTIPSHFREPVL